MGLDADFNTPPFRKFSRSWAEGGGGKINDLQLVLFRSLGKGLGCVLIKSTLGPGKTQKGWGLEGEGYAEQWGTKRDSLRATWD